MARLHEESDDEQLPALSELLKPRSRQPVESSTKEPNLPTLKNGASPSKSTTPLPARPLREHCEVKIPSEMFSFGSKTTENSPRKQRVLKPRPLNAFSEALPSKDHKHYSIADKHVVSDLSSEVKSTPRRTAKKTIKYIVEDDFSDENESDSEQTGDVEESLWCGSNSSSDNSDDNEAFDETPRPFSLTRPPRDRYMEVETLPRYSSQRINGSVKQLFSPEQHKTNALILGADNIANGYSHRLTSGSSAQERPSSSSSADNDAVLRYSPPRRKSPQKIMHPPARPRTPPPSTYPTNSRLTSPSKKKSIPTPPHQQSADAFWSQEVINSWNDEHSPQKPLLPRPSSVTGTEPRPSNLSGKLSPIKKNPSTVQSRKSFEKVKHQIAHDFLEELDKVISGGKISEMAADCGGVKLIWSKKLNSTAGRANWKRESLRVQEDGTTVMRFKHYASIELAEKVIDDEDRLVNVIAHEYCHLANFMISGIRDNPHGKEFKEWAKKVTNKFGSRNIAVTTKHSYEIDYKYVWTCVSCRHEFKRHSKSIDPIKHSCGGCKSKLIQTKPAVRQKDPTKGPSEYQLFVKENFHRIKRENNDKGHRTVMEIMGMEYRKWKAEKEAVATSNKLNDATKALETIVLD